MDQISAMLGLDLDDEQKARLMADQLRGRKQAADFFGMTTIPQIAKGAQQEGQDIMDSAQRGGALRQTMAQRDMTQGNYDEQARQFDARQAQQQAQFEAEQEDKRLTRAIEQQKINSPLGLKPSATERDQFRELESLTGSINTLDELEASFTDEQKKQLDQPLSNIGLEFIKNYGPQGADKYVAESKVYTDPAVREYMANGLKMESRISQLAAGLALTKFEIAQRQNWSPFAPGISQGERKIRLNALRDEFARKGKSIYSEFPQYLNEPEWAYGEQKERVAPVTAKSEIDTTRLNDPEYLNTLEPDQLRELLNKQKTPAPDDASGGW